jgi:tetratricopeptide (TPR) repeat protein/predicted Ser/Thr protein kinase
MSDSPRLDPPLVPGSLLGRYRIDAPLGAGGMGAVFRAHDTTLERPLAIKVLHADADGPDPRQRLLREARSASALNHPAICTVYEVGEDAGRAFIAMEYVDGQPLSARLDQGPLAVREAVQHGIDVADALGHAHSRGIVHRDLKAANAILTSNGRLKLVDFGLARRLDPQGVDGSTRDTIAAQGALVGTPYAMAPEQVRGEPADARSDIWALGVLLFEMLTATRPFRQPALIQLLMSILRDAHEPLARADLPASLRKTIDTCLAKAPESRYQRAEDVRSALERVVADLSGSARSVAVPAGTPLPPPLLLTRAADDFAFVGRERERQQLGDVWKRAKDGRRQLMLIAGEPGIGKTRLSLEFARSCAGENGTVLVGRCDEDALVPYQPFVEALGWYARVCPEADLHAALAAAGGGGELGPFATDFLVRVPDLPPPLPMNAQGQRYRLFETVNALLAAASKTFPILLILDDLHWADKPTLSMLRHVVRGSDPAELCILGTYRESELIAGHPLAELLADFRREQDVTRLSLTGLERVQVGKLVEAIASPEVSSRLTGQMTDSTGGNPFFVAEMLRHLRETGALAELRDGSVVSTGLPEGVREVISRRVSRLSEGCRRAMNLASVLGREFDVDVLEALSELSEDEVLDAIDEARRAQIIDEVPSRPGRHSFHHALIKDTLYEGLAVSRRLRLHRRAGEAIERVTAHHAAPPLTDLAYHFSQAATTGVADRAADYATRAGDHMAGALAHEEAARFYDLALSALDSLPAGPDIERQRVALHRRRGWAFSNLGQWAQQRAALAKALAHLSADALEERCEMLAELSQACFWLFDIPALEQSATEALHLAERTGRQDLSANSLGWLARCRQAGGALIEVIEADRATIARFGAAAKVSHNFGGAALYWAGRGSEAVAIASEAVTIDTSRDATFTMNVLSHYALTLAAVGRYVEAMEVFGRAREFGRKYGVLPMLARVTSMSAGFRFSLGDLDGAEAIAHEARELAQRANFAPSIVSPGIDLLLIAARRGEPGRVEKLFEETLAASKRTPGWHGWLWDLRMCQVRAELAAARGEWETARLEATEGIGQSRKTSRRKYEALGLLTRAQALQRLGRTHEAILDAKLAVTVARSTEDPALLLQALDLVIQIDGDDGLASEAGDTYRRILDALPEGEVRQRFGTWDVARRVEKLYQGPA